jgi:hypothetical protein
LVTLPQTGDGARDEDPAKNTVRVTAPAMTRLHEMIIAGQIRRTQGSSAR